MKPLHPIQQKYDPPLVNHFRGRAQGLVYYSMSVKKDADTLEMLINNPAIATSIKLEFNEDQTNQIITILEKSLEALKTGKGNESPRQENK